MKIHPYVDFTWPELKDVPRSLPVILPLGVGMDLETAVLDEAILLEPIPYGWPESGLGVPAETFRGFVDGTLSSLGEDGWQKVFVLAAEGDHLPEFSSPTLRVKRDGNLSQRFPDGPRVVLIPVGHTEQHAYHLPFDTDTRIIEAIAIGTNAGLLDATALLPVLPYGVSTHRSSYFGTLNVGGRAYEDFLIALLGALGGQGHDRFFLLNGHGGNHSYLVNIVKAAGERYLDAFTATSFLYLSATGGVRALEQHRTSGIGGMGHAGELETSLMLHLDPKRVYMERAVDETDFISTPNYYMDWIEGGALIANPPWYDDTQTGAYGAGSLGTAEKGRLWLDAAVAEKILLVKEIHDQQRRRMGKRVS
jgi:creatinine amidohydrolase